MIQYIDAKGSPFAADAPTTLQNIVTKEIMSEKVRHDILMASTKGKEKYIAYRKCVFVEKSQRISSTINRLNLNTMANNTSKPEKTTKARVKEINIMDRNIEVARERGLTSQDLLQYDVVPSPMLFDDDGLMTKPEKIETKMSFSHAGLSMHSELKIDEQAVSRIVSEIKNTMPGPNLAQMDFEQLGGFIKFSDLGLG